MYTHMRKLLLFKTNLIVIVNFLYILHNFEHKVVNINNLSVGLEQHLYAKMLPILSRAGSNYVIVMITAKML